MSILLGHHKNVLDAKGRVSLPSVFRRALSEGPFVLLQWKGSRHLTLLTEEGWANAERKLLEHRRATRDGGRALRALSQRATSVTIDKQGRIRIPDWLLELAELTETVVFIGAGDRIELWDPARLAQDTLEADKSDENLEQDIFSWAER